MGKILFNRRDLAGSYRKSKAMEEFMKDPKVAEILNKPRERKELFSRIKEYGTNGNVTREEMRAALADLKYGTGDHIDRREARHLREALGMRDIDRSDLGEDSDLRERPSDDFSPGQSTASKGKPYRKRLGLPF